MCDHEHLRTDWVPRPKNTYPFDENELFKAPEPTNHKGYVKRRYCTECGIMESKGNWKGKKFGYFANILGTFRRNGLTHVQVRLICKKMRRESQFTDEFGTYLHFQIKRFIEIVREYTTLERSEIMDAINHHS